MNDKSNINLENKISFLEAKIKILEEENKVFSDKAEQTFLINIIMEELQLIDKETELLDSLLERISILTSIPYCSYYELEGHCLLFKNCYASFSQEQVATHQIILNSEELKEIRNGYAIFNFKNRLSLLLKKYTGYKNLFLENVLLITTVLPNNKFGVFLFAVERCDSEILESFIMLLNHVVDIYLEKVGKLKLEDDLRQLNSELENLVEERTSKLKLSEEKFRQLFEYAGDGIFLWEVNSMDLTIKKCLAVNTQACFQLGYSKDELMSLTPKDFNVNKLDSTIKSILKSPKKNERFFFESEHIKKDGTTFPVEITSRFFKIDNKEMLLSVARDISLRKKEEENRKKIELELQQAHKMESLGTLAGGIAHDFNNLLAGISGSSSLIRLNKSLDNEVYKYLDRIDQCVKNSKELIEQILHFSRKSDSEIKNINLVKTVKEELKLIRASLPSSINIDLKFKNNSVNVNIDESNLSQILMNLCVKLLILWIIKVQY